MSERPTRETDAEAITPSGFEDDEVSAEFARKLERERDEARAEMIRWMSIAEGRGRTDDEEENDTQSELAAWEMLTEATRERDEANKELHKQIVLFDELFAEAEKIRIERDEARSVASDLSDIASKHLSFLLAITPTSPNDTHEKETEKVIDALNRWKKL